MRGPEIKILGPFEVTASGDRIHLGGPRRVGLLARLALDVGRTVSTDRILADVWGQSQAATAAKQVHIVVSKLRELLPGRSREIIATIPRGYRLDLAHDHVDAHLFTALVGRAREARTRGDTADAAELLRQALALWRGAALADVSAPWAQIEATRLEEERLTAIEDRTDLLLAMSGHDSVLPELAAHVDAHPLRERSRAQLMLALYRSRRPAEALSVYRDAHRTLVDELGIEPGPELRRLEHAVLANDPGLDLASPAPETRISPPAAPAVPAELPPDTRAFTARATEIARLRELLTALPALAAIDGPGCIGKSSLAIRVAHTVAHRFGDGVLYLNLRGATARHTTPWPTPTAGRAGSPRRSPPTGGPPR